MNTIKTTPKDFFMHLGATVVLYAAVIALINLAFSVINYFMPDNLAGYFSTSSIAWPVSMLIVLIPLLYILEWFIVRDVMALPEKLDLWIRRWRIYLTLFLTGATIVGDLIALVYTFLNGEITGRFVYKALAVFLICGIIFAYYMLQRSTNITGVRTASRSLAAVGLVLVLIAIVGGFMAVGSPATQRALRFDSQRTSDLSSIQWQVLNYWQSKGKLPANLAALADSFTGYVVPVDPDTAVAYDYAIKGTTSFELCATFARKSVDGKGRGTYPSYDTSYPVGSGLDSWTHEAGKVCFDRTIDPEKYPVTPKPVPVKGVY